MTKVTVVPKIVDSEVRVCSIEASAPGMAKVTSVGVPSSAKDRVRTRAKQGVRHVLIELGTVQNVMIESLR